MKLSFYPFSLQFRYPFKIAHGERSSTPVVFVELEEKGITGYGEAALPPYLSENTESVILFLNKVSNFIHHQNIDLSMGIEKIMGMINKLDHGNAAAKAAIDIALHDLYGKTNHISLKEYFQTEKLASVYSTFTIGISNAEEVRKKISEAENFNLFKLKLDGKEDKKIIENFINAISETEIFFPGRAGQNSFFVDVNQAWKDKFYAMDMIYWLHEKGAMLIEQPLPVKMLDETARLTEKSPVPIVADESVQDYSDLQRIYGAFSGINIKLMKCGGLIEAKKMISRAKELKMLILIGCMSESSCAVTAAAHLSPYADWADLDGPYLIKNDPFEGVKITEGKISIPDSFGLGIRKK